MRGDINTDGRVTSLDALKISYVDAIAIPHSAIVQVGAVLSIILFAVGDHTC